VQVLERDLAAVRSELSSRTTELKEVNDAYHELKAERCTTSKSSRVFESQVLRLQKQVDELKGDIAAKDTAIKQHRDDARNQERNHRTMETELKARNGRLNRALEEVQRYRTLLEEAKAIFRPRNHAPTHGRARTPMHTFACTCTTTRRCHCCTRDHTWPR
jgi:chromosome segregation ATPase